MIFESPRYFVMVKATVRDKEQWLWLAMPFGFRGHSVREEGAYAFRSRPSEAQVRAWDGCPSDTKHLPVRPRVTMVMTGVERTVSLL